ncbi:hypothetical protein C8R47DRAFT_1224530 [Mycena vitilis]|nr:hypothetical protein C8R47DRAFT_1224530 [Mycena vitilis]
MSAQICSGLRLTALGLSLAYATNGTVIEQWSRDYLNKSDTLPSPIERARICSYLYIGHKRFHMPAIVDLIPLLPHMSLLLFFAGLVMILGHLFANAASSTTTLYKPSSTTPACSSAPALLRTGESGFLEDDVRTGLCLDALLALAMAKVGTDTLIFLVEISTLAYVSAVARTSDGCVGAASDVGQLPCAENEARLRGSVDECQNFTSR